MLTKLLKKSEGPTRVVPTQIKRAVKQVETRIEKRKPSGFKLPSFARAKKPAAHSALVEQYVFALHEAGTEADMPSSYRLADIQLCAEIDLGVVLSMGEIEDIVTSNQATARKSDWFFKGLDHLQAYIVLDAVKEIVETTHSTKREKIAFAAQLQSMFDQDYGAAVM
jgi:hypothetical protein